MIYVKNKVVTRGIECELAKTSEQTFLSKGLVKIVASYTFDFFFEVDRDNWFSMMNDHSQKLKSQTDLEYLGKENVIQHYIQNARESDFVKDIIPAIINNHPQAEFYNQLVSDLKLFDNHIMPEIRRKEIFRPLTPLLEKQFVDTPLNEFEFHTIEIPWNYAMRTVFQVNFNMYFNIQKYLEYMIVTKKAKFHMDLWPGFYIKLIPQVGWPFLFTKDRQSFYRMIEKNVIATLEQSRDIQRYIYNTTKIRLDQVRKLKYVIPYYGSTEIHIEPLDAYSFAYQLIAGKIDIFSKRMPSAQFDVQKIDVSNVKNQVLKQSSLLGILGTMIIFVWFMSRNKRKPGEYELRRIHNEIRTGKIDINDIKI